MIPAVCGVRVNIEQKLTPRPRVATSVVGVARRASE